MEKYTLKQEDFQDINVLIDLGKSIKENEEKLIELEIQGKKQSPEYKSTLDCIKSTLFLEANIFRNIGANPAKISAIIAHLTTASSSVVGIDKQLSAIVNGSTRDLITQRIILRLNEIMINIDKEQINQGVLCINKETNMVEQILKEMEGEIIPEDYFSNCYMVEDVEEKIKAYNLRYNKETQEFEIAEDFIELETVIEKSEDQIKIENLQSQLEMTQMALDELLLNILQI